MSVLITKDQRDGIDEAMRWETEALAELGAAHLACRRAADALEVARERRAECERRALHAERQRTNVVSVICDQLNLGAGKWRYDAATGTFEQEDDDVQPV